MQTITSIGGDLWIYDNNALENIEGLENIAPASIIDLNIYNNPLLSHCEIANICEYLLNPAGAVNIFNNAPGCNNQEQVDEACLYISIPENDAETEFTISPNPIGKQAKIEYTLKKPSNVVLQILDFSGRVMTTLIDKFQTEGEQIVVVNESEIKPGVYFCVLLTEEGIQTMKMIKL